MLFSVSGCGSSGSGHEVVHHPLVPVHGPDLRGEDQLLALLHRDAQRLGAPPRAQRLDLELDCIEARDVQILARVADRPAEGRRRTGRAQSHRGDVAAGRSPQRPFLREHGPEAVVADRLERRLRDEIAHGTLRVSARCTAQLPKA